MQSLTLPRRASVKGLGKTLNIAIPVAIAVLAASAAYAGADTTFTPALTKFTDFLEGSGGKIITVLSLAGGLIGLASGRFSLGHAYADRVCNARLVRKICVVHGRRAVGLHANLLRALGQARRRGPHQRLLQHLGAPAILQEGDQPQRW